MVSLKELSTDAVDKYVSASDLTSLPSPELVASVFSSVKWHTELDAFVGPSKPRKLGLTEWGFLFIPTDNQLLGVQCWTFLRARSERAIGTTHLCAGHI